MNHRYLWVMIHAALLAGSDNAPAYAVGLFAELEEMQRYHEANPCECELYPLPLYGHDKAVVTVDPVDREER
jgi:hypothetical protein